MKRLLIATVALTALAGAALAQPAYDASQGSGPETYPPCTHRGQDRCIQHGGHHAKAAHAAKPATAPKAKTKSSTDGERG